MTRQHPVVIERRPEFDRLAPELAARAVRGLGGLVVLQSGGGSPAWTYVAAGPLAVDQPLVAAADPFATARDMLARLAPDTPGDERAPGRPPWTGGLAGYLSYDLGWAWERRSNPPPDDQLLPILRLGLYDWVLAWNRRTHEAWLSSRAADGDLRRMQRRRSEVLELVRGHTGVEPQAPPTTTALRLSSNVDLSGWVTMVERARAEIAAGELYQVNLARRLEAPFETDPWPRYEHLARREQAPFGAYLELDDAGGRGGSHGPRAILSASPEQYLAVDGFGRVRSDPIKGTRPRGGSTSEDRVQLRALLESAKDRAENVMIVDVVRNDLGRVCRPGSVRVDRLCRPERTRTVVHLVSTVTGELDPEHDSFELLRAVHPGASITGAPKIRAMELIDELEPVGRGPYTGAAVWVGRDGALGASILIRTFVADGRRLTLHVGGGITWRSDPVAEWEETEVKARGPLEAVGR